MTIQSEQKKAFNEALKMVEASGKTLEQFYKEALKEVTKLVGAFKLKLDQGTLLPTDKRQLQRLNKLYSEIDAVLKDLYKLQANVITDGYVKEYTEAYYKVGFAIERDVNMNLLSGETFDYKLNYSKLNPGYVKTTFKVPVAGMTFLQRNEIDRQYLQFKIQGIIDNAIRTGLTPEQVAAELQLIDSSFATSFNKAITTARTELLRGYSYGQEDSINYSKYVGVDGDDIWDATLDKRVRPSHAYMDQKKADENGYFYVPGPRGREQTKGPRMPGLSAANAVNCRCKKLHLPFGVEPSQRGGRLPDGDWATTFGGMDWQEWASAQQKAGTIDEQTAQKLKIVKKLTL